MKSSILFIASITIILVALTLCTTAAFAQDAVMQKIHPWVVEHTKNNQQAEFIVMMTERPDLSPAFTMPDKESKGRFVYETLLETANRSQAALRKWLEEHGKKYQWFYTTNALLVKGDWNLAYTIAQRDDVKHIYGNPEIQNKFPVPYFNPSTLYDPLTIEWNISQVHAPQVWALGYRGQGVVVGAQDTGYRWTHTAVKNQYRGWNGTTADHNYNWHDSIHPPATGGTCGADSTVPCDDYGHGTHTLGTVLGSDFSPPTTTCVSTTTNQVGMAPCARWIGCRNMDQGAGTPARYIECFDFFLAPYPIGGTPSQGDPSKSPDVTTNSWGCPASEGCTWDQLQPSVDAHYAAGIMFVAAAGNSGSSCNTITDAPAMYQNTFTVGATDSSNLMASFSSRGPGTGTSLVKPNISAPGVSVRSAYNSSDTGWTSMDGTSMATPHVAGAVALLWSCLPGLKNDIDFTRTVFNATDTRLTSIVESCGGDYVNGPNNTWGYGLLNIQAACNYCTAPAPPTGLTATTPANNTVHLVWNAVTGATTYKIYRASGTCPATKYFLKATVSAPTVTYDDTSVSGGLTYAYIVRAASTCPSANSTCAQATATGNCTLTPSFAGLVSASSPGTSTCQINLAWAAGTSNCPAGPNITYHIYKDTNPAFVPASTNRIAQCVTGTTFADTNVVYGTTYYYIVRSEDSTAGGSGPCNSGNIDTNLVRMSAAPIGPITTLFSDTFEVSLGNWTVSTAWQWVTTQSHSVTHSAWSNNLTSQNCDSLTKTTLVALPAGSGPALHFWTYFNLESGYDSGVVYGSSNGTVFTKLTLTPNYPGTTNGSVACNGASGSPAFSGVGTTWTQYNADLSMYAGGNFKPRFTVATDASVSNGGWWIDDVSIDYGTSCTSGPSPAGKVLNNLKVTKTSGNPVLNWAAVGGTCSVLGYEIYRGTLPWAAYNHASINCATVVTTYTDSSAPTSYYYLVVPYNNLSEGSYGTSSSGTERPQGSSPCKTQSLVACN